VGRKKSRVERDSEKDLDGLKLKQWKAGMNLACFIFVNFLGNEKLLVSVLKLIKK
jgi:hypothetical protein